ncbi:hypothetical protein E6P78_08740 [Streptomyces sp. A0958]|uniref:hypothetical protein n=1 Tax=Streptomyces sp. A0958 TaxID=2563101 RepID=UPI00109EA612|nr:hypothetical protein [Streptomyces sp. A0958]THA70661.1 hypothetical protein E6P78_08740 [Streptomyces sp. A0958]
MPDTDPRQIPGWPLVEVLLTPEGAATVNGSPVPVPAGGSARAAALARAADTAARIGRPVRTRLTDAEGAEWLIALSPDGTEAVLTAPEQKARSRKEKRRAAARPPVTGSEARASETAAPEPVAPAPTDTRSRITAAVDARDWPEALRLCAELVDAATPVGADPAFEIRARVTGLSGDGATAYARFRDLADLRLAALGPAHPHTVAAAEAAQEQWARLGPDEAARLGDEVFALRARVPGPDGRGAARARRHLLGLHAGRTRLAAGGKEGE